MTNEGKKRKFISSLTFKTARNDTNFIWFRTVLQLCDCQDDVVSEQEQQEEQQRNAVLDTVDVVGDYL